MQWTLPGRSLNHLIRPLQERLRNRQAEGRDRASAGQANVPDQGGPNRGLDLRRRASVVREVLYVGLLYGDLNASVWALKRHHLAAHRWDQREC